MGIERRQRNMTLKIRSYLLCILPFVLVLISTVCIADVYDNNPVHTNQEEDQLKPEHVPIILSSIIGFFAFLIGSIIVWYLHISRRNKQKHEELMALIEKGEYNPAWFEDRSKYRKEHILLSSILLIVIGVAIIIGVPMATKKMDGIIAGLIPFFIGLGLFIFYRVVKHAEESKQK